MKYSAGFRNAILRKVLPPNSQSVYAVAKEAGISAITFHSWLSKLKDGSLDLHYEGGEPIPAAIAITTAHAESNVSDASGAPHDRFTVPCIQRADHMSRYRHGRRTAASSGRVGKIDFHHQPLRGNSSGVDSHRNARVIRADLCPRLRVDDLYQIVHELLSREDLVP